MTDPYGRGAQQDTNPRCWRCNRMLALLLTRPWSLICPRCKARVQDGGPASTPAPGGATS